MAGAAAVVAAVVAANAVVGVEVAVLVLVDVPVVADDTPVSVERISVVSIPCGFNVSSSTTVSPKSLVVVSI